MRQTITKQQQEKLCEKRGMEPFANGRNTHSLAPSFHPKHKRKQQKKQQQQQQQSTKEEEINKWELHTKKGRQTNTKATNQWKYFNSIAFICKE